MNVLTIDCGTSYLKMAILDEKGQINTGAVQTLFDSAIGQNAVYRQHIMEQLAVQVLKSKGKDVGKYFTKRNITFDPSNPTKIYIHQTDHNKRETKFSLDFNMATGQTAVSFVTSRTHKELTMRKKPASFLGISFNIPLVHTTYFADRDDVDFLFSNGLVDIQMSGERTSGGSFINEVTTFKYSADAQKGHDSLVIDDDSNQIVDKLGVIASNLQKFRPDGSLNPNYLLYGMDNIAGVTNIGGQAMPDFILQNILRTGRNRYTNKFSTGGILGNFI